jgi:transcriptional regulator with XRE-family HTH domain
MFAQRLKELMSEKKLGSGYQLAKELNVSQSMVDNWISGKTKPTFEGMVLLCKYFNVSADYLLEITDAPVPPAQTLQEITAKKLKDSLAKENQRGVLMGFHGTKPETITLAPKDFSKIKAMLKIMKD